jgi:hypothetical protein
MCLFAGSHLGRVDSRPITDQPYEHITQISDVLTDIYEQRLIRDLVTRILDNGLGGDQWGYQYSYRYAYEQLWRIQWGSIRGNWRGSDAICGAHRRPRLLSRAPISKEGPNYKRADPDTQRLSGGRRAGRALLGRVARGNKTAAASILAARARWEGACAGGGAAGQQVYLL